MWMYVSQHEFVYASTHKGQKTLDPLELKFQCDVGAENQA